MLERIVLYEARSRGIQFDHGGSFGFRGHRFEAVIPESGMGTPFLRIAMGARGGASCTRVIELLSDIAAHADFEELCRHHDGRLNEVAAAVAE